jgi:16S rRNA (cytidine1402-2'-O)-methyltransferase
MRRRRGGVATRSGTGRGETPRSSGKAERKAAQPSDGVSASKPRNPTGDELDALLAEIEVPAGLHVVATPIGNAADLSLRALAVLRRADLVACEDTRVTAKLAQRYGIATRRFAYHEHNADRVRPELIGRLRSGATIALVSDAGTPLVSDPGYRLVRAALAEGLPVTTVPGPSAPLAALVLSGLPSDRFLFAGFLPPRRAGRQTELRRLAQTDATLIFFEAPHRLVETLADMSECLGDREAAVARELTKLFEEVRRGGLVELARHYAESGPPKGEIVLVVAPPKAAEAAEAGLDERLRGALERMSLRDASNAVAEATGMPRRAVYARALEILGEKPR